MRLTNSRFCCIMMLTKISQRGNQMKIVHDIHTHNVFSHCCSDYTASTEAYIAKEREIGNRVFGLSNHIWDERVKGCSNWYRRQTIALAEEAKAALKKNNEGVRCLFGTESEFYGYRGIVGMSLEGAKHFDYVLIPHSHLHMRNEVMADYPEIVEVRRMIGEKIREACPFLSEDTVKTMTDSLKEAHLMKYVPEMKTDIGQYIVRSAIENFYRLVEDQTFMEICKAVPTAIAHPFNLCGVPNHIKNEYLRLIDDAVLENCFTKARNIGAYVEINTGSVWECGTDLTANELMRVFAIAKRVGCQFTFGTDSHSVAGLEGIKLGDAVCDFLGMSRSDIAPFLAEDGVVD